MINNVSIGASQQLDDLDRKAIHKKILEWFDFSSDGEMIQLHWVKDRFAEGKPYSFVSLVREARVNSQAKAGLPASLRQHLQAANLLPA